MKRTQIEFDTGYSHTRPTTMQLLWASQVLKEGPCRDIENCPCFHDWCNCENAAGGIFEDEIKYLQKDLFAIQRQCEKSNE